MEENFNNQIKEVLNNETLNQVEIISKLKHIISETEFKNYNNRPTKTMANIVSDNFLKKIADPDYSQIIKTGFNAFDENFAGFTLGELIIIGARPGMGKTQLLINLCLNISKEDKLFSINSFLFIFLGKFILFSYKKTPYITIGGFMIN